MINPRPAIAAMSGYVPGEQPQGGKLIKLNTNENPYPPSPKVMQAIQATAELALSRYPDPDATAFRTMAGAVLGVNPDWILCGNGSDDLLTILTRTFVGEGQSLRMPNPSYSLYRTLAEIQGAQVQTIRFHDDWTLPQEFSSPEGDPHLAFLPNPNSPSGTSVPTEQVAKIASRLPCPLVVDEAYGDFSDSNCVSLVQDNQKIIVTRSLSKSYALAGLRFGFAIAQPAVIAELKKVKDSYNCDAISIAAATAAISDQTWLVENRAKIIASRERFGNELVQLGFQVQPSQANFLWCTHPEHPAHSIYQRIKTAGILVRYMSYDGWGDGIRITVGTDSQLDACLLQLKTILA